MNVTVVDDSQYFTAIIKYEHSDTEPRPQVDLDYNINNVNYYVFTYKYSWCMKTIPYPSTELIF